MARLRTAAALRTAGVLLGLALCRAARQPRLLLLGGSGQIGTSCAAHLLRRDPQLALVLGGRNAKRGEEAAASLAREFGIERVSFEQVDWMNDQQLRDTITSVSPVAVVHTAGPYNRAGPVVLQAAIDAKVPVYVDLSDPIPYIEEALGLNDRALAAGTTALLCAGAFPGLSNLIAMECASRLPGPSVVQDLKFSYFTAGLGGSGEINLVITNEGFGDPVPTYQSGALRPQLNGGLDSCQVRFYLDESDASATLVGERLVWAWPFPEAATVARQLRIAGDSSVRMGTAPAIWNTVLGLMVSVIPRTWWRDRAFSEGLAAFSRPLVALTDVFVGETHAMRIDVTSTDGGRISAVQAHKSFRGIVGQSCAEFTLELLEGRKRTGSRDAPVSLSQPLPSGVFTPEALFESAERRGPLLKRMLAVDGTLNWGFSTSCDGHTA